MRKPCRAILTVIVCAVLPFVSSSPIRTEDAPRKPEDIAAAAQPAVVVIKTQGRSGDARSQGSGFVLRADGVIATNLHVIGEGRRFTVELAGKTVLTPRAILAFDRSKDLALLQVDGSDLPFLPLGDSKAVRAGQSVIAIGNPLGLGLSASSGAIAEVREIHDRSLIQVAIPIEPGSSGGPLIDMSGNVVGIIAIKGGSSTGFAIPIDDLKPLLASSRPIPIERWFTIGALDSKLWRPILGGEWRQRAGRIVASGSGDGFGGRTLCLSEAAPPEGTFELGVEVKLEDESGAAGIAFHSDGGDRHYGFYPTQGSLRLTCFEGPDVFSWRILRTVASPSYRPGEWNAIRVRLRGSRITCLVNGEAVIDVEDHGLKSGKVGIVKFRAPGAEFRSFRVGPELDSRVDSPEIAAKAEELGRRFASGELKESEAGAEAARLGEGGILALRARSRSLEKEAGRLAELAELACKQAIVRRLEEILGLGEAEANLLEAALLVSKLDNADLDLAAYLELVDRMARDAGERLSVLKTPRERVEGLARYMFEELLFHGSTSEYYNRSNSYLNEVLDDREGIPITLSVVFLDLSRRVALPVVGIGLPGHFVVEFRPADGERQLIEVFGGGKLITRAEAVVLSGDPIEEAHLEAATPRQIIVRMLSNLLSVAQKEGDAGSMLRYLDALISLESRVGLVGRHRWSRAALHFQAGKLEKARDDVLWMLDHEVAGGPRESVEELLRMLEGSRE